MENLRGSALMVLAMAPNARNQGAARAAAQRPTAPSGGRFCNVSARSTGQVSGAIK
jgi:hypothetical protein